MRPVWIASRSCRPGSSYCGFVTCGGPVSRRSTGPNRMMAVPRVTTFAMNGWFSQTAFMRAGPVAHDGLEQLEPGSPRETHPARHDGAADGRRLAGTQRRRSRGSARDPRSAAESARAGRPPTAAPPARGRPPAGDRRPSATAAASRGSRSLDDDGPLGFDRDLTNPARQRERRVETVPGRVRRRSSCSS